MRKLLTILFLSLASFLQAQIITTKVVRVATDSTALFQFQYGAIKRKKIDSIIRKLKAFQFQYGAIKRNTRTTAISDDLSGSIARIANMLIARFS